MLATRLRSTEVRRLLARTKATTTLSSSSSLASLSSSSSSGREGRKLYLRKESSLNKNQLVGGIRFYHATDTCSLRNSSNSSESGSSESTYHSYEYPMAKEAPEISRTTAAEAIKRKTKKPTIVMRPSSGASVSPASESSLESSSLDSSSRSSTSGVVVPTIVDDSELSPEQIEIMKKKMRETLNTKLTPATAVPITKTVPPYIPPNIPSDQLTEPETIISVLDNGIRVVSQETYGQVSTVGVISDVGSRLERPRITGVTHLLEFLAFGTTNKYSLHEVTELLQNWGGQRFVTMGREQTLHCIDLLRPNVDKAMDMLYQVLVEPQFLDFEVENAKDAMGYQAMTNPPELLLGEALQTAAYGADQQLGQPHYCPVDALPRLTPSVAHNFWQHHFVRNPKGIVVAGAGIQHDQLLELTQKHFGSLQQQPKDQLKPELEDYTATIVPSVYRGGESRHQLDKPPSGTMDGMHGADSLMNNKKEPLVMVALALEVGGWHSAQDLVPTCVLNSMLGGGRSFSSGGPGKGMYSRLYRQVLNRYSWAESAEAFTAFTVESGLFGITGSTSPHNGKAMVDVFVEHLKRLARERISDEELSRAKNMLKNNVLSQLESRLTLFEDLGRQVLTYGYHEDIPTTCRRIDSVTAEDIQELVQRALTKPVTVACIGHDLSYIPTYEQIMESLRNT